MVLTWSHFHAKFLEIAKSKKARLMEGFFCSPSLLNPNPNVNPPYGWVYIELELKNKALQTESIISVESKMFDRMSLN